MHAVIESSDSGFSQYWDQLYNYDPIQNPLYLQMRKYRTLGQSPLKSSASQYSDRSFLVVSEDEPVFACSLTSHVDEQGRKCLGYFGTEASIHVNRLSLDKPSNQFKPEAIRLLQQHLNGLLEEIQPDTLDYLDPVSYGIMSPLTQLLLQRGAVPTIQSVQLIDLSQTLEDLYMNLDGECRKMVDWGMRSLSIDIVTGRRLESLKSSEANSLFTELDDKADNSIVSNKLLYEGLIKEGKGFLVQARYRDELVSSSLFVHTEKSCYFVFGEVLPGAPDKPLLHALIWQAILHAKAKACNLFDLGCSTSSSALVPNRAFEQLQTNRFGGETQTRLKVSLGLID